MLLSRFVLKKDSLQFKILLPYIFLIIISLILLITIALYSSAYIIENKVTSTAERMISQTKREIDNLVGTINTVSLLFVYDENLVDILGKSDTNQKEYLLEIKTVDKILKNYLLPFVNNTKIYVTIIGDNNKTFVSYDTDGKMGEVLIDYIYSQKWFTDNLHNVIYKKWISSHNNIQPLPDNDSRLVISLLSSINEPNTGIKVGSCIISIPETRLSSIFENVEPNHESEVFIINEKGIIISHPDNGKLFSDISSLGYLKKINSTSKGTFTFKIGDSDHIILFDTIVSTGWKIVEVIPEKYLFQDITKLRNSMLVICFVTIIMAVAISYFISTGITKPIKKLVSSMQKIDKENLDVFIVPEGNDEINQLGVCFNNMLYRLKNLINDINFQHEEKRKILIQKKQEEIDLLQAQINPHFLFNTLNSIKWMATISQSTHVSKMIGSLGSLLEASIGKVNKIVPVKEEIEYTKKYISLMQLRFNNSIKSQYFVEENLETLLVPKLILQPIVENSLLHGFRKMKDSCLINISVYKNANDPQFVTIEIKDNGVGMTDEKLENVFNNKDKRSFTSIALKNVDERIKYYFGKDCGLSIESKRGKGTTVKVIIMTCIKEDIGE